eukprot:Em0017g126a
MARMSASASGVRSSNRRSSQLTGNSRASVSSTLSLSVNYENEEDLSPAECFKRGCSSLYDATIASCCYCRKHPALQGESSFEDPEEWKMKERLKFHFMDPFQKWDYQLRKRFPWKLIVQLISISLVTAQVILFAQTRFTLNDFIDQNTATFVNLFVKDPADQDDASYITPPIKTIYTIDDLYDQIEYTRIGYRDLRNAVGPYGYGWGVNDSSLLSPRLTVVSYIGGMVDPERRLYNVSGTSQTDIFDLQCSLECTLNGTDLLQNFDRVISLMLNFNVTSVYTQTNTPDCVQFEVQLKIENDYHSGSMPLTLSADPVTTKCTDDDTDHDAGLYNSTPITTLDAMVILVSLISLVQCGASLLSSVYLHVSVKRYFDSGQSGYLEQRGCGPLRWRDFLPLYNLWFIGIILSNLLSIVGSFLKILLRVQEIYSTSMIDTTSIILALSVFGQWCGILRFLSYFDKYNMMLITLRVALPSVIRFIVCGGVLYFAFLLCGWLVLGPYHPKFRNVVVTSECLYALLNGDDMFATFKAMGTSSTVAWVFSKVYLYIFIALFIYVVLNVFISLISDAYERIHVCPN